MKREYFLAAEILRTRFIFLISEQKRINAIYENNSSLLKICD